MADRMRLNDPLDDSTLLVGIRFSKAVVIQKGDTLWVEAKTRFDRANGTTMRGDEKGTE